MNTYQIDEILKGLPAYRGTFSCDTLPKSTGIMVSNVDPSHKPGTHWVSIYISPDRQHGEYFDSFGRRPNELFSSYMNERCRRWTYNKRQLQSVASKNCGRFCVLYCVCRSRGVNMFRFVKCFTRDTGFNDALVVRSLRNITSRYRL